MEFLRAVVERSTYRNEENGFTVLRCRAKGYPDLVTVVGTMPGAAVGSVLSLMGEWRVDGKYGRQFCAEKCEESLPATAYGIEKYLGSGLVKGIGPKFARKIVEAFGEETFQILDEEPDRLLSVEGIGAKRVENLKRSWQEQKEIRSLMVFLQEHDVSTAHAVRIFQTYGADSIAAITENPYRLADDIWGIGFRTADQLAAGLGMEKNGVARLRSGLLYTLNQCAESGDCYAGREELIGSAAELLDVEREEISATLDEMLACGDVIPDGEAVYLPAFFQAEAGCADRLLRLLRGETGRERSAEESGEILEKVKARTRMPYQAVQQAAIRRALSARVMVLTGGPGTGKTTTTRGILAAFQEAGLRILLAAPTGRAAKRLSEATGMEAKTIHRLLEYKPPEGYQRNEENPLEADVLIVDECSMIDLLLMYHLLKALPDSASLILVGDVDQLPSVGAGQVLRDIIESDCVPVVRLTEIFRQAQNSRIVLNAHRINRGQMPDLRGGRDADFFFAARESAEESAALLVRYCTENLPRYYQADAFRDIQVLTPMQKGVCGAAHLNELLQEAMNASGPSLSRGGTCYRLRDKVMQIRNDYDRDVFNGDIGIVSGVDLQEGELTVDFDGRPVRYERAALDELVLAYAITIHKAQGSEYPIVVMPVTMSHYVMLQRNLLYTGVTRARKILVLIGEKKAVSLAVHREKTTERKTKLAQRLREGERRTGENAARSASGSPSSRSVVAESAPVYNGQAALFKRLSGSRFRSRFSLNAADRAYVREKGMETIRTHARDFVRQRLAPAEPLHDGKQTPMRGHPVFLAQHATATCCRSCLEKWHRIPKGKALTREQQDYIVDVIMEWIRRQMAQDRGNRGSGWSKDEDRSRCQ